jgi:hypothetical protein
VEKTFRGELMKFRGLLLDRTPFALARFGHSEMEIVQGKLMHSGDVSGGHEYRYAPADPATELPRRRLIEAFVYRHPRYYVGINCPHCIKEEDFEWMREHSGQPEEQLTFSTLTFYSNYVPYLEQVMPIFNGYETVLVCHENGLPERLPFRPVKVFRNRYNAWQQDWHLVDQLKNYISENQVRGGLFLFCAGALGTMLAHQLFLHCPENTYLDTGSAFDPWLFTGMLARNRRYLKQDAETQARESCYWKPLALPLTRG